MYTPPPPVNEVYGRTTPTELFHYTSYAGLLGILESGEFWATSIHCLNDSREFAHGRELAKHALADWVSHHTRGWWQKRLTSVYEQQIEQIRGKERLCCVILLDS
jgi:hypothetical protein